MTKKMMMMMMIMMRSVDAHDDDDDVQFTTSLGDRDYDRQWEKKQKAPHSDPRPGKVSQNI